MGKKSLEKIIKALGAPRGLSRVITQEDVLTKLLLNAYNDTEQIDPEIYEYVVSLIRKSGYFDAQYYLNENKDVKDSGIDPLFHYIYYGGKEGRKPSELVDTRRLVTKYPKVREWGLNPLVYCLLKNISVPTINSLAPVVLHQKDTRTTTHRKAGSRVVDIINVNFYDWTGKTLYKGGAERYVFDLAKIIQAMGYEARIIQNATQPFEKMYRGVQVIGVETGATDTQGKSIRQMSKAFAQFCKKSSLVIASPLDLACEITEVPTIGINHGIHWDSKRNNLHNYEFSEYAEIFDALDNLTFGVCVDTNFINWVRTYDYDLAQKLRYIPNYYDASDFKPVHKKFNDELNIMYPRRLYEARGIFLTLDAFEEILKKYKKVNLLLVGQTTDENVKKAIKKLQKKYAERVSLTEYAMEDMHQAYEKSHVVLIPTLYSEGTSLSCLEAMATNNAIIATNIGGLPNLVIDGINGLLIEPNKKSLIKAIENLVEDRDRVEKLATEGQRFVEVFEKKNWDEKWEVILGETM